MNRKSEIAMNDGCIFFGFKLREINHIHIAFQLTTGHDKIIILVSSNIIYCSMQQTNINT